MIYLDRFGHLFSDVSIDELYKFAVGTLGLKPEWNHYSRHLPHFDLTTKRKQAQARVLGAIYLEDTKTILELYAKCKPLYPMAGDKLLPYVKGAGLHGQAILRVDFPTYFKKKIAETEKLIEHARQDLEFADPGREYTAYTNIINGLTSELCEYKRLQEML